MLNSDIVTQEVEVPPSCIIKHPGFDSLRLDKWALRYAATKMRTKNKQQYRQISTEAGKCQQIELMRIIIYICEIYIYTDIQAKHCYIDFVDSFGAQLTEVLCGWCMVI